MRGGYKDISEHSAVAAGESRVRGVCCKSYKRCTRVIWHVMMKMMISRQRERGRERRNIQSGGGEAGGSQCRRRHQTAERKREENSGRARVSCLRAVTTKALTRSNRKKKITAPQNTKTVTWAVTLSHNIKSERGTLEILSKRQSILASNVSTV